MMQLSVEHSRSLGVLLNFALMSPLISILAPKLQIISQVLIERCRVNSQIGFFNLVEQTTAKVVVALKEEVHILKVVNVDSRFCDRPHRCSHYLLFSE